MVFRSTNGGDAWAQWGTLAYDPLGSLDFIEPALAALRNDTPDVLITDIRMSGQSGLDLLRRVHDAHPELPVIVMTAYSDLGSAVTCRP